MPLPNGFPLLVDPDFRDGGIAVWRGTVASGVVTKLGGLCTLSDFTTGAATGTFPKCKKAVQVFGESNTDNASSTSRHKIKLTAIDAGAGTCTVRCVDENNGATENPADGTIYFGLLLSW
jgi:hypothetical protein